MKRRTVLAKTPRLRDRRTGQSPYAKYKKTPYRYRFDRFGKVKSRQPE